MFDVFDLVCHLCGLDGDADYDAVYEAVYEKYGIELQSFEKIVTDLMPLIDVGTSPITGKTFKGFSAVRENGNGFWLVKMEVKQ